MPPCSCCPLPAVLVQGTGAPGLPGINKPGGKPQIRVLWTALQGGKADGLLPSRRCPTLAPFLAPVSGDQRGPVVSGTRRETIATRVGAVSACLESLGALRGKKVIAGLRFTSSTHPRPSGLQPAAVSPAPHRPLGPFSAPPAPSSAGDPGGLCQPDGPHFGGSGYGRSLPAAPAPGRRCPGWVERRRPGGGSGRVNLCASLVCRATHPLTFSKLESAGTGQYIVFPANIY